LEAAGKFASQVTSQGGLIVFVGTKRQAKGIVKEAAIRCGMPYVTERWLGGLLTNFQQLQKSLHQLQDLKSQRSEGKLSHLTKKERLLIDRKIDRLEKFFGGVTQLKELPQALFIVDAHNEDTAVREANNRNIKIIGLVDSNTNPDPVDYVIPANDDAVKSIQMIVNYIAQSILEGQKKADKKPVDKKNES
jgi:small subunit ribosomal protein S2